MSDKPENKPKKPKLQVVDNFDVFVVKLKIDGNEEVYFLHPSLKYPRLFKSKKAANTTTQMHLKHRLKNESIPYRIIKACASISEIANVK